jgi:hypothetical protein
MGQSIGAETMIVEHVLTTETVVSDLASFTRQHPNAQILRVDGRECFGKCAVCGTPLLAGDQYVQWNNGELTCGDCRR